MSHSPTPQSADAELFFASLVRATQDALVTIDGGGRVVDFNPAAERMFGWARDEIIGHPVAQLMPPEHAEHHDAYVARYERTGEARAIGHIRAVEAQRRDGTRFPIELSVAEVAGDEERPVRYGAFIRDVTEREELLRELVEKERLATVGEMAATLAHEIGNPLNNMQLQSVLLERRLAAIGTDDSRVLESLHAVRAEVERLGGLLAEFRHLARRQHIEARTLDLRSLVEEVTAELALGARGVRVGAALPETLRPIQADRAKLKQVLLNLGMNSLEAMAGDGVLTVSVRSTSRGAEVEVRDTGPGIPKGVKIYDPFVSTKDGGTGLGLAVAARIAAAHGGSLRHVSEAGDTRFTLRLPDEPAPGDPT